jgi:2-polyprenyl-6-methoxyphenol hydroxylase-like FAD-dependent oxidoreductase
VTIIGGSIAGLTTGLALLRNGWDVHVFDASSTDLAGRGAGIITHPLMFDRLKSLGIKITDDVGVKMRTRKTFAKDGRVIASIPHEQVAASWGRIYQLLREQFPDERYHVNARLHDLQQLDGSVTANFTDGNSRRSELLIAADGIRSTVRQRLEPNSRPEYVGYMCWRGLINEQDLGEFERDSILPHFTFCLPEGEQVLTYPVTGELSDNDNNYKRMNVVWYRPAAFDTTLKDMLTDIDGNYNGISITPGKIRPAVVKQMCEDAVSLLSPHHAKLLRQLKQPFIQPVYDLTSDSMVHKNIALVGDAAFTARPHLGAGITKAVEDGIALARALENEASLSAALSHYNETRSTANRALIDRSRALGAYLQAQLLSADERRHARQHRTIESVMKDTANIDF